MAEGWLRHFGNGKIGVFSAGTRPSYVHPIAIEVMKEAGIDISSHRSKSVNEFIGKRLDYVITVCDNARDECPFIPGNHTTLHMPFKDPVGFIGSHKRALEEFRKTRDEIAMAMKQFATSLTSPS
jgi:arsenate reductase